MEVYYERLLKLANNLQHKIINSFLTTIFRIGLQPYMCVAIIGMKEKTLKQHNEVALVCEKIISEVEAINNMLVPQSSETVSAQKPLTIPEKT